MSRHGLGPGYWLEDPVHPRGSNRQAVGYATGSCPNAEWLCQHILNLPLHPELRVSRINLWLSSCRKEIGRQKPINS
jgi:dTDP-4-amino-4,6-dideoxygalactose transaminase